MAKPKIPEHVRFMAQAKQKTKDVAAEMASGLSSAIKSSAPKIAARLKGKSSKSKRNPWPRCGFCHFRVPMVCIDCACAEPHITQKHKTACCPGPCLKCGKCLNVCQGHKDEDSDDQDGPPEKTSPRGKPKGDDKTEDDEDEGQDS